MPKQHLLFLHSAILKKIQKQKTGTRHPNRFTGTQLSSELPVAMTHSDKHLGDEWVCISLMKLKHAAGLRHISNHDSYFSLLRASCGAKQTQFAFLNSTIHFIFTMFSWKALKNVSKVIWLAVSLLPGENKLGDMIHYMYSISKQVSQKGVLMAFNSVFKDHPSFNNNIRPTSFTEACTCKGELVKWMKIGLYPCE